MAGLRASAFPAPMARQAEVLEGMARKMAEALAKPEGPAGLAMALKQGREALWAGAEELSSGALAPGEAVSVCRALCRMGEDMALAALDMENLGVFPDRFMLRLAGLLRDLTGGISLAFKERPGLAQRRLAAAKAASLEIQMIFRRARASAFEDAQAVKSLKMREIYRRLSDAGMAADKAIEASAWILAENGRIRAH